MTSVLRDLTQIVDFRLAQQCFCCEGGCDDRQALSKWKLEVRIHLFFNLFVFLGSSVALSCSSVILSSVVVSLLGSPSGAFFVSVAAYLTSSINSPPPPPRPKFPSLE